MSISQAQPLLLLLTLTLTLTLTLPCWAELVPFMYEFEYRSDKILVQSLAAPQQPPHGYNGYANLPPSCPLPFSKAPLEDIFNAFCFIEYDNLPNHKSTS